MPAPSSPRSVPAQSDRRTGDTGGAVDENLDGQPDGGGRRESEQERADRNFTELLQELRVAQTGVQILFAFLLTLPFTERFNLISAADRYIYLGTLLSAATASAFLIAPVSWHRILFRQGMKPVIVTTSDRLALVGLSFLVLAVTGAVFLIFDFVAGGTAAGIVTALMGGLFITLWFVMPLVRLRRENG